MIMLKFFRKNQKVKLAKPLISWLALESKWRKTDIIFQGFKEDEKIIKYEIAYDDFIAMSLDGRFRGDCVVSRSIYISNLTEQRLQEKISPQSILMRDRKNYPDQNIFHFLLEQTDYPPTDNNPVVLGSKSEKQLNYSYFIKYGYRRSILKKNQTTYKLDYVENLLNTFMEEKLKTKPIEQAVKEQFLSIWKTLILNLKKEQQAEAFSAQDNLGNTPGHYLLANGAKDLIQNTKFSSYLELLTNLNAEDKNTLLTLQNNRGNNLLHYLCMNYSLIRCQEMLGALSKDNPKYGSTIRIALLQQNQDNCTPLYYALEKNFEIEEKFSEFLSEADKRTLRVLKTHSSDEEPEGYELETRQSAPETVIGRHADDGKTDVDWIGSEESEVKEKVEEYDEHEIPFKPDNDNRLSTKKQEELFATENLEVTLNEAEESEISDEWCLMKASAYLSDTLLLACESKDLKRIQSVLPPEKWNELSLRNKKQAFVNVCSFGNQGILQYFCKIATSSEVDHIIKNYSRELYVALTKNPHINKWEFDNTISKKICLIVLFHYLVEHDNKSSNTLFTSLKKKTKDNGLHNFIQLLKNLCDGVNPRFKLSIEEPTAKTKKYHKLLNIIANQPQVLAGSGKKLYDEFIEYFKTAGGYCKSNLTFIGIARTIRIELELHEVLYESEQEEHSKENNDGFTLLTPPAAPSSPAIKPSNH